jgi:hypothetical protein
MLLNSLQQHGISLKIHQGRDYMHLILFSGKTSDTAAADCQSHRNAIPSARRLGQYVDQMDNPAAVPDAHAH